MGRFAFTGALSFAVIAAAVLPAASQTPAQKPSFEVASVKLNNSAVARSTIGGGAARFLATSKTLRALMQFAYSKEGLFLSSDQIIGGPDWLDTDHFDIEAKPQGDPSLISGEQARLMVQSLLEDRFHLKVHHELRQLPVYNLVVAKNGPKLKLSDDQKPPVPGNNRSQADTPSKGPQGVSEPHRGR